MRQISALAYSYSQRTTQMAYSYFRYREALAIELPWLGIGEKPAEKAVANNKTETVTATVAWVDKQYQLVEQWSIVAL